ncbi:antiterminator Q family protein [Gilliamella mensalis]|uniref:antiterminator Q family protein n=1 Tax=Gilliamella mensalis TaxID=1908520 RepID=UPI000A15858E|nr:antiterminator Q family protein [Gilliamella mensalis]
MIETKVLLKMWSNSIIASGLPNASRPTIYNAPIANRQYLLDEEVERIERAMTDLFNDSPERHSLVKSAYIHKKSCSSIAKIVNCRTDKITLMLSEAEFFIRGRVIDYFKNR